MTDGVISRSISTDSNAILSNSSSLITRTTIREANNHLQMLYIRNQELEQLIHEQKEEIQQRNFEYSKLYRANQLLEQHCQQLQALLDDRTQRLYSYERKEVLFQQIIEFKPTLESLVRMLNTFEQSSSLLLGSINNKPLEFVQAANRKIPPEIYLSDL
ncbi:unnamed protein product [Adineta ricciae]|uniref:Uncharacterized protein n=1 Tax=Adineta ricciae TaxID=249248 RepID=A0A816GAN2_ADIRI|nr:unnamed protein product [Adineta ricciae]CAF1671263.1 unnamed protein product [Adineta ricciae]